MHSSPLDTDLHALAKKRVELKMAFFVHLAVFLAVHSGFSLLGLLQGGFAWRFLPFSGWALGLAIHGLVTLLSLHGPRLRQRLMVAELKQLRQRAAG